MRAVAGAVVVCSSIGYARLVGGPEIGTSIVGGEIAKKGEYPWIAALLWGHDEDDDDAYEQHLCGGTLIDEFWVLTAAHCVSDGRAPSSVVIGARDLTRWQKEDYGFVPEERAVTGVAIARSYDDDMIYNDVALLRLAAASTLPTARVASSTPGAGVGVTVMGWGDTTAGSGKVSYPEKLHYVNIDVVNCDDVDVDDDHDAYLCASPKDSREDSCQGDSGGPLVDLADPEDPVVVGVVSWGWNCKGGGVYADVADFRVWIDNVVAGNACVDDAAWLKEGSKSKGCSWVFEKPSSRCKKKDDDGLKAQDRCLQSCGCDVCADDGDWFTKKTKKDCAWVAKKSETRCSKENDDNVPADDACHVACGAC